jgi:hypothetical protein
LQVEVNRLTDFDPILLLKMLKWQDKINRGNEEEGEGVD